jgi:predicted metal-dependent phosphoesterase TrpH
MMRAFKADLHIHSCLSPCAELEMSPRAIIRTACEKEIDILGICDHNSAENVSAILDVAKSFQISVLAGMEVTSQEEAHILGLFDKVESALALQDVVYAHLPGENDEDTFGMQVVVNPEGEVLHLSKKLLIGASTLALEEVVRLIHSLDGLAVASHIDRESFSLIGQLGFIPEGIKLDALEVSPSISYSEARQKFNYGFPLLCSSDAHRLKEIGQGFTSFLLQEGTSEEILLALKNKQERKILGLEKDV